MTAPEKQREAAGSVWNAGSWQWEERNLNKDAQIIFEEAVKSMKVDSKNGVLIGKLVKCDNVEGSISIRKGKKIVCWNLSAEVKLHEKDDEDKYASFKFKEVGREDLEDCDFNFTPLGSDGKLKLLAKKEGKTILEGLFKAFDEKLASLIGSQEQLEKDKALRASELEKAAKAKEETGDEKAAMLAAQKKKEAEAKAAKYAFLVLFGCCFGW